MPESPRILTVVLELHDGRTEQDLMAAFQNSTYIDGCSILNILEGNIPDLLSECESEYNQLLMESIDNQ